MGGDPARVEEEGRLEMEEKSAKFSVGQLVHHRLFDYRGIVFDVDPEFQGTEEWYRNVARSHPPKDRPWYHVLPDGESHTTYVAERNLEEDRSGDDIHHPLLGELFERTDEGSWISRTSVN